MNDAVVKIGEVGLDQQGHETKLKAVLLEAGVTASLADLGADALTVQQQQALVDVVESERSGEYLTDTHANLARSSKNLFDSTLTTAACNVLRHMYPGSTMPGGGAATSAAKDLHEDGIHFLDELMSAQDQREIVEALASVQFASKSSGKLLSGYRPDSVHEGDGATHWVTDHADLQAIPAVQRLISSPAIVAGIEEYFGAPPVHVQTNCWWTVPTPRLLSLDSLNAQRFHQDREYIRFVKVFVYLTDVGSANGPHRFVTGSHLDFEEVAPEGYQFSDRLQDSLVEGHYDSDRILNIEGKAGTMFLADTSALHAGSPVEDGHRLLLQIEYAISGYFGLTQPFSASRLTESCMTDLVKSEDRMMANYDDERYESWKASRTVGTRVSRSDQIQRVLRARAGELVRFAQSKTGR